MKTNRYLLPHVFKKIGLWLLVPMVFLFLWFLASSVFYVWDDPSTWWAIIKPLWLDNNINTVLPVLGTITLLLIAFSREKVEDEYITALRGDSLIVAVVASYVIHLAGTLLFNFVGYVVFMACNAFGVLVLFLVVFHVKLFRLRHEK